MRRRSLKAESSIKNPKSTSDIYFPVIVTQFPTKEKQSFESQGDKALILITLLQ